MTKVQAQRYLSDHKLGCTTYGDTIYVFRDGRRVGTLHADRTHSDEPTVASLTVAKLVDDNPVQ